MANRKCEKCGSEEFDIVAVCSDKETFVCTIDEDNEIDAGDSYNSEVGATTYSNKAKCYKCSHECLVNPELTDELVAKVLSRALNFYEDDDVSVGKNASDVEMVEDGFWVNALVWVPKYEVEGE
ncbi:MAG: hypothetical protein JEZ11_03810 [Desulfobacterales bacterium]|nr:hypothetical protein [Desulfobacterales bacterium]